MEWIHYLIDGQDIQLMSRLFVAVILGLILGTERVRAHKTAGPRTYALVAMGAALFVITGDLVTQRVTEGVIDLHVAAQIIAGVGFLAAGVVMLKDSHVIGLTTASGLWVTAAIGMATGYGFYLLAVTGTFLTLFVFTIMWHVEEKYLAGPTDPMK